MPVLAEVENLAAPGTSLWVVLNTTSCSSVQSTFDLISAVDRETEIKRSKPAPSTNKRWSVDNLCLLADPLWAVGRNPDGSLSTFINAPVGSVRQVRLTLLNAVPAATPVTITAFYQATGYQRVGLIDPNNPPRFATLHVNVASGSYSIELLDNLNAVIDTRTIPVTATGPELSFYAAGTNTGGGIITPPLVDGGASETYTGTFVSPQGLATRPDRLLLALVSYDAVLKRAVVSNTVVRNADAGREFAFSVNGSDWMNAGQFAALRFAAGNYYLVNLVERAIGDNAPFELEKRQLQQGYYVAEQTFIIH